MTTITITPHQLAILRRLHAGAKLRYHVVNFQLFCGTYPIDVTESEIIAYRTVESLRYKNLVAKATDGPSGYYRLTAHGTQIAQTPPEIKKLTIKRKQS